MAQEGPLEGMSYRSSPQVLNVEMAEGELAVLVGRVVAAMVFVDGQVVQLLSRKRLISTGDRISIDEAGWQAKMEWINGDKAGD